MSAGSEAHEKLNRLLEDTIRRQEEKLAEQKRIALTVDKLFEVLSSELKGYSCGSDTAVAASKICTEVFNRCIREK